ncbi:MULTISPECIES: DegV family protein [unclassified Clostridioides]|uniref:DegV family protein n=1 Tax=unclassified Clostridioides TaxID=2635829 RepID=UPI001D0C059C|nr:DegV family protein [Clostridioides sp. ES-S-0001-02]MCC0657608.1 DegV family protein [Clostridioides sp. ES-S-0123-01]MCC0678884.1 DegV family protein [Clostridioides sp. ES-S-0005-03]MCC0763178.1 DegV family protein [Clostridioides sp. ES-S-0006-03]UDN48699.1 DegV family protein [Clostridioides sp. ES-S-0173-01]UDN57306.1 DegV family protein [Clostridioides sp. ES-S-0010-02]
MKIKLVCDSLCDIPDEISKKDYIEIVPLTVIFNDREYIEGVDIDKEEFYKKVKEIKQIPKTSQATYMEFKEVFDKFIEEGYHIICLTGASNASGTFQSAVIAKNDMNEKEKIHIFDTRNLSLGSGQYVIKACELVEEGLGFEEIINELENIRSSIRLLFAPYTLDFLKQSGRVPVATALIGNMLNIKPIFFFDNGEAKLVNKVRGVKNIASKLVDIILEMNEGSLEGKIVTIGCGDNLHDCEILKEEVNKRIKARRVLFTRGGVSICSHTGPDILAISCSN